MRIDCNIVSPGFIHTYIVYGFFKRCGHFLVLQIYICFAMYGLKYDQRL
jgi:hypothetical protein